jgi:BlaI family transcriptional regulator, penicillinase repressor
LAHQRADGAGAIRVPIPAGRRLGRCRTKHAGDGQSLRKESPGQESSCSPAGRYVTDRNVTQRDIHRRPLTELQQAILDFIWSNGPATSEEIREALRSRHPLKDSSVRTLLRRLEARGYMSHRLEGKVFVYRADVRPRSVAARAVQHIIERFCAGSVEQFLVGMVDEKVLPMREIERLARKVKKQK